MIRFLAGTLILTVTFSFELALANDQNMPCQEALTAESVEGLRSLYLLSRTQAQLDLQAILKAVLGHPEQAENLINGWDQEVQSRDEERTLRELYLQAKVAGNTNHELWIAAFPGAPDRIRALLEQWDAEAPMNATVLLTPSSRAGNPATAVTIDQVLRSRMLAATSEQIVNQIPSDLRIFDYRPFAAGSFIFGSDWNDSESLDHEQIASPQTQVSVVAFELGNYIPQWVIYLWRMETGKLWIGKSYHRYQSQSDGDFVDLGDGITMNANHPGTNISYDESLKFVAWWNAIPEIHEAGCIYNLPTQVQWEYAARYLGPGQISQDSRPFPATELNDRTWNIDNACGRTHALGLKPAHPNGLYDMYGNVWTLTLDSLDSNNYQAMPTLQPGSNHFIVRRGSDRVLRGGGYSDDAKGLRSPARGYSAPGKGYRNVSLRLTRTCP